MDETESFVLKMKIKRCRDYSLSNFIKMVEKIKWPQEDSQSTVNLLMILLSEKFPETTSFIDKWNLQQDFLYQYTSWIRKYVHEIVDDVILGKYWSIDNLQTYFNILLNSWKINLWINKSKEITEFIAFIDNLISISVRTQ